MTVNIVSVLAEAVAPALSTMNPLELIKNASGPVIVVMCILAVMSLAYMGADTISNLVWGYMADRQGFRSTFVISTALNIVGVAALLACNSIELFAIAFFLFFYARALSKRGVLR